MPRTICFKADGKFQTPERKRLPQRRVPRSLSVLDCDGERVWYRAMITPQGKLVLERDDVRNRRRP